MRNAAATLLALGLASGAQAAETIRLGDSVTFEPYVLGQLDEAGFAPKPAERFDPASGQFGAVELGGAIPRWT